MERRDSAEYNSIVNHVCVGYTQAIHMFGRPRINQINFFNKAPASSTIIGQPQNSTPEPKAQKRNTPL